MAFLCSFFLYIFYLTGLVSVKTSLPGVATIYVLLLLSPPPPLLLINAALLDTFCFRLNDDLIRGVCGCESFLFHCPFEIIRHGCCCKSWFINALT